MKYKKISAIISIFCACMCWGFKNAVFADPNLPQPPIPQPSPSPSPPIFETPKLDLSVGLVGMSFLPNFENESRLVPNFGPFFRVSHNLLGPKPGEISPVKSYMDIGGILFATYTPGLKVNANFLTLGGGASFGFFDQAITVSPSYMLVLGDKYFNHTFLLLVTSSAFKF